MATVGSANRVDGVDLQLMVNAAAFARPQAGGMAAQQADGESDARISSAGRLRSATSAVLDAASRLSSTHIWQATKASSDNEALVQAVSDKARPGQHVIEVDAVATSQTTSSPSFSSLGTLVGIGTLQLELGHWNSSLSTFATNPNWPKANVTLGPKDTTMEHVRDKINAAGVGVIATVVSDATGSRLVLRATSTGAANGFRATSSSGEPSDKANEDAARALAQLGFDPTSVQGSGTLLQPAQDARLSIDGRDVQSPQNLIEDEKSGLALRLHGKQGGRATITVETDTDAMVEGVLAFAGAYNNMVSQLQHAGPDTQADTMRAAHAIQQRMESAFSAGARAGTLGGQLKAVGVQLDQNGQLSVNAERLGQAIGHNPTRVEQLFNAQGIDSDRSGLAARLLDITLPEQSGAQSTLAGATSMATSSTSMSPTAAGAQFRQRLLEQYTSASLDESESIPENAA